VVLELVVVELAALPQLTNTLTTLNNIKPKSRLIFVSWSFTPLRFAFQKHLQHKERL
jgi:hypothetical protein